MGTHFNVTSAAMIERRRIFPIVGGRLDYVRYSDLAGQQRAPTVQGWTRADVGNSADGQKGCLLLGDARSLRGAIYIMLLRLPRLVDIISCSADVTRWLGYIREGKRTPINR